MGSLTRTSAGSGSSRLLDFALHHHDHVPQARVPLRERATVFGHVRGFQRVHAPRASHRGEEGEDPGPRAHVHHHLIAEVRGVFHHGGEVRAGANAVLQHVLLLGNGGVVAEVLRRGVLRDLRVERVRRIAPRGGGGGGDDALFVGSVVVVEGVGVGARFPRDGSVARRASRASRASVGSVKVSTKARSSLTSEWASTGARTVRMSTSPARVTASASWSTRQCAATTPPPTTTAAVRSARRLSHAGRPAWLTDAPADGPMIWSSRAARRWSRTSPNEGASAVTGPCARARLGGRVRWRGERREGGVLPERRRRFACARLRSLAPHRRGAALARALARWRGEGRVLYLRTSGDRP